MYPQMHGQYNGPLLIYLLISFPLEVSDPRYLVCWMLAIGEVESPTQHPPRFYIARCNAPRMERRASHVHLICPYGHSDVVASGYRFSDVPAGATGFLHRLSTRMEASPSLPLLLLHCGRCTASVVHAEFLQAINKCCRSSFWCGMLDRNARTYCDPLKSV